MVYLKYFFYLGFNWNFRIAAYIIWQEMKGEKKYGITTTGADELKSLEKTGIDISHATVYMPITYFQVEEIFRTLPPENRKHFMDIGCGKGRALCVAAHHGYEKVTGVDFSEAFCIEAKKNLESTRQQFPGLKFSVIENEASLNTIPLDVDCIFLFNPFDAVIMKRVIRNITTSLKLCPRNLNVAYANPLHKQLFLEQNFTETHYSRHFKYLEFSILNFRP
jgi:SAM-dependent methyltransferase